MCRELDERADRSRREPGVRELPTVERGRSTSTTGDRIDDHRDAHASPEK
jgi:hypothetical protein